MLIKYWLQDFKKKFYKSNFSFKGVVPLLFTLPKIKFDSFYKGMPSHIYQLHSEICFQLYIFLIYIYRIFLVTLCMHICFLYFAYVKKRKKSNLKDCLNLMSKNDLFHVKVGVSRGSFSCYRNGQLVEK